MPGVLCQEVNQAAIGSKAISSHRTVEALRDDRWLRARGPAKHADPACAVTFRGCLVVEAVQSLAIRPEHGSAVTIPTRSKLLRFPAFGRRLKEVRIGVRVGRLVPIGRSGENDGVTVGRPGGPQLFG